MRGHMYGPHNKADQPQSVLVFRRESDGGDYHAPVPELVRRQRWQINSRAHQAAQNGPVCMFCPLATQTECNDPTCPREETPAAT